VVLDLVVVGFRGRRERVKDRAGWRRVAKEARAHQELQS
jgi:hypothetical protein